ncbi:MAG: MerR family transcriptional regulator [Gammaproteobacteria bacterium]
MMTVANDKTLPEIPDKRYFTIGEVSELCTVKPYVLRYWEQEFKQLQPTKRRGNRRYYQREDVMLVRSIRDLLYHQGFTIAGAKQKLESEAMEALPKPQVVNADLKSGIAAAKKELLEVLEILEG